MAFPSPGSLTVRILVSAWLSIVAVWDWRTGLIPNWLTLPMTASVGAFQLYHGRWFVLLIWGLIYLVWRGHIIGGGDAKFLMGLFALFPTQDFALVFGITVLAVSIVLMVLKHWSYKPVKIIESIAQTLKSGQPLPSQEDLEREGRRYAWTFCLPGILYTWWLW